MKINNMGGDYFAVIDEQGKTLAIVDLHSDRNNPSISVSATISFWELRNVMWQIEEFLKK